ncbi:MAG TPA: sulfite exporter TauE/SafE family protein [Polyangiaceae bacterium]|nr:sulfite exporter TauE/SafE family protein [Polyangiaceae bacterium]
MPSEQLLLLASGILVIAFLYSSVGHAGASGYIAVMSLFGLAPALIKPTALALNILVASLASWQFWRAGHFSWKLFWPFALLSVPLAFVGGYVTLPTQAFRILVGAVLLLSAARLLIRPPPDAEKTSPSRPLALSIGGGIGLLSGLTGTGGGIFLTPIVLFKHWASAHKAGAVSALFILFNSVAGLLGNLSTTKAFPAPAFALLGAAGAGGALGSYLGSRRFDHTVIKRMLAVVLIIAGGKLVLTR